MLSNAQDDGLGPVTDLLTTRRRIHLDGMAEERPGQGKTVVDCKTLNMATAKKKFGLKTVQTNT